MPHYIRTARLGDAALFPAIERSAGLAFAAIAELAWIAEADDLTVERYQELISCGASWVCDDESRAPIGFLCAEPQGEALHVWELAVRLERQRGGIGRELLAHVIGDAYRRGFNCMTLTTFRDVLWNAPFYEKLGFREIDASTNMRMSDLIRADAERGAPAETRCAMKLELR